MLEKPARAATETARRGTSATRRHPPSRFHNYLPKIAELDAKGLIPADRWSDIEICHNEWCDSISGRFCNCDPDVSVSDSLAD